MATQHLPPSGAKTPAKLVAKRGRAEAKEARSGRLFVAPFLIMFTVVFLIPMIVAIRQSFFTKKAAGGGLFGGGEAVDVFVGLEN